MPPAQPVQAPATPLTAAVYAESVGLAVIAAGRRAQQLFDAELAHIGLTMRHLGALGHLARDPDLSISDLARRSGVTAQSMHATVRGLEELGAITSQELGRGRAAKLRVTDRGQRLLVQTREATARMDEQLLNEFGASDAATLHRILSPLVTRTPQPREQI